MNVASLVSTEWSDPHGRSSAGLSRSYDQFQEKNTLNAYFPARSVKSAPQLPLSPPADELRKCSLPSIASLLERADGMPPASTLDGSPE